MHRSKARLSLNVCKRAIKMYSNEVGAVMPLPAPHHIFFLWIEFKMFFFFYFLLVLFSLASCRKSRMTTLWIWTPLFFVCLFIFDLIVSVNLVLNLDYVSCPNYTWPPNCFVCPCYMKTPGTEQVIRSRAWDGVSDNNTKLNMQSINNCLKLEYHALNEGQDKKQIVGLQP